MLALPTTTTRGGLFTQPILHNQRQPAHALAGRGEERVRNRTRTRRKRDLAETRRGLAAIDDMHFDCRCFRHPQQPILTEVALHGASALDRDLAMERHPDTVQHATLRLRLDARAI